MRNPDSSHLLPGDASRGVVCATIVAILACAPFAHAEGGGRLHLTRDGRPVDIRAEGRSCSVSGASDRRDLAIENDAFFMRDVASGDLLRLSFPRSTTDAVVAGWTRFHVADPSKDALLEWRSVPIAARVLTARGEPAPGVLVRLLSTRPDLPVNVASMEVAIVVRTDASGRCEFRDVPYGEYSLSVQFDRGQVGVYSAGSFECAPGEDSQLAVRRDGHPQEVQLRLRTLVPRLRFASPVLVDVRVEQHSNERGLSMKGRVGPGEPWDCLLPEEEAIELRVTATLPDGGEFVVRRRLGEDDGPLAIELPAVHSTPSVEIEVPGADSLPAEARWSVGIMPEFLKGPEGLFEQPFFTESWFALPEDGRLVVPHVLPGRYMVWLRPEPVWGKEDQWIAWSHEYGRTQSFRIDEGVHHIVLERE